MSEKVSGVINFVNNIPAGTNPFLATATMMDNLLKAPRAPGWSRVMTRLGFVTFGIMFFQSAFLLYQRLRIKEFRPPKFNKLGLLTISVCDVSAVVYTIFTFLTIVFLSMQLALEHDKVDDKSWFIFGFKFLVIMLCPDAYVWGCACLCAVVVCDSKFVLSLSSVSRERLRFAIKWTLNISFLATLLLRSTLVLWYFGTAYHELRKMMTIIHGIHENLLSAASTYNAQNYTKLETLRILFPAQQLIPLSDHMGNHIFNAISVLRVSIGFTVVIYIPLMSSYLRGLYKQNISQSALDLAGGQDVRENIPKINLDPRRERRRVVYHGLAVYFSTAIYLPVLFWQAYHSQGQYLLDPTWRNVTYHGLSIPFSVTGNIVILILNLHSRRALIKIKEKESNPTELSETSHRFSQRTNGVSSHSSMKCVESNSDLNVKFYLAQVTTDQMSTCTQNGSWNSLSEELDRLQRLVGG